MVMTSEPKTDFWRDASYVRLKEILCRPIHLIQLFLKRALGVSNLLVYAIGNNLWTKTGLIEGDPERKDFKMGFLPYHVRFKIWFEVCFLISKTK